jgi:pyridoxamine 5'-phosphate oxidase
MALAPWRSPLAQALHRNRSLVYSRYLQLATVQAGRPANRTLVFRGFGTETNQLKFITDARSEKVSQIQLNPWAEACWYFPKTREQFRLTGTLMLIDATIADWQKVRSSTWHDLSDHARSQFAWPHPGEPRAAAEMFAPPLPDPAVPLPNFCLLLLDPVQVDHLELRGEPQNRSRYQLAQGEWSIALVNP